jgi:IS30 family transposase
MTPIRRGDFQRSMLCCRLVVLPKGPARRPQSAKREQFMRLLAPRRNRGRCPTRGGVSRTTGNRWKNGYDLYRRGELVGRVAPLDRLAERTISSRFLSVEDHVELADRLREAHRRSQMRGRPRTLRVLGNAVLHAQVAELLKQRWSPKQISRELRVRFPEQPDMRLSAESIYRAIYRPNSTLRRASIVRAPRRSPLRTSRDHRRAQVRAGQRRRRFTASMLSVHERPFPRSLTEASPDTGKET